MKFLFFLFIIGGVFFLLEILKDHIELNTYIKAHQKYSDFTKKCFSWIEEISDKSKQKELLTYYLENISISTHKSQESSEKEIIDKSRKIYQYRNHILKNWGDHIPSLKAEVRDLRINQILEN